MVLPLLYRLISITAFIVAGMTMSIGIHLILSSSIVNINWVTVFCGAILYIVSQALRSLRLAIIVGDPGKSVRQLIQAHLVGAASSFVLPYKIGDALRMIELSFVLRRDRQLGLWRALLVMWIERVYDALPITVLLLFLGVTVGQESLSVVAPILVALSFFVATTLMIFFVLPENLDGLALFLARRYHGQRVVIALRYIDRLHRLIADARRMLHRKHITLGMVSSLIWGFEVVVVALIFGEGTLGDSAVILLRFLSSVLSPTFSYSFNNLSIYSLAIGAPLLLLGVAAWFASWHSGRLRMVRTFWTPRRLLLQRM